MYTWKIKMYKILISQKKIFANKGWQSNVQYTSLSIKGCPKNER